MTEQTALGRADWRRRPRGAQAFRADFEGLEGRRLLATLAFSGSMTLEASDSRSGSNSTKTQDISAGSFTSEDNQQVQVGQLTYQPDSLAGYSGPTSHATLLSGSLHLTAGVNASLLVQDDGVYVAGSDSFSESIDAPALTVTVEPDAADPVGTPIQLQLSPAWVILPGTTVPSSSSYSVTLNGATIYSTTVGTGMNGVPVHVDVGQSFTLGLNATASGTITTPSGAPGIEGFRYGAELDLGFSLVQTPQINSVTDSLKSSSASDPKTFGEFLQNVPIADTFTVTTTNPDGVIAKVTYQVGNAPAAAATLTSDPLGLDNTWTFDPNVATIPFQASQDDPNLSDDALVIKAYDAQGNVVATYNGTLVAQDDVHSGLTITPPGVTDPVSVAGLRFLEGVELTGQFQDTFTDLPSYYEPFLRLDVNGAGLAGKTTGSGSDVTVSFPYDVAQLTGDEVVHASFATPKGTASAPGADSEQTLHAVPVPDWLADFNATFDTTKQAYVLTPTDPWGLKYSFTIAGVPNPVGYLINGRTTRAEADVNLTVTAKLTNNPKDTSAAVATVNSLTASLVFLNEPVFDVDYPLTSVHLAAPLNPDSLQAASGVKLTTDPIDLLSLINPKYTLFDLPFGTGNVPLPIPAPAKVGGTINLKGEFQALASTLTVQAGLQLDVSGADPKLVKSGTFVDFHAVGAVSLALGANLNLGLSVLPFPLFSALAAGGVSAVADTNLYVSFSGDSSGIKPELDLSKSWAGFTVGYAFDWNYSVLDDTSVKDLKLVAHPLTDPIGLFGLNPPPTTPDFHELIDLILSGPGNFNTPGAATLGSGTAAPSSSGGAQPQAIRAKTTTDQPLARPAVAAGPTSTLTIATPLTGPLSGLGFSLDVVSDRATLPAGVEFLDTDLLAPDGTLVPLKRVDLSTLPLSSGGSNLGYASGATTIQVPIGPDSLGLAVPYEVEFLLTDDSVTSGHQLAVTLSNLSVSTPTPTLSVAAPDGATNGGHLAFTGLAAEVLTVTNTGTGTLVVSTLALAGSGFTLVNPPTAGEFALPGGESVQILVEPTNPSRAATGSIAFSTDDPAHPSYHLSLTSTGTGASGGGNSGGGGTSGGGTSTGGGATKTGGGTPTGPTSPPPAPPIVTAPPLTPVEWGRYAFVNTLYRDVLGRAPDAPGLAAWVGLMDVGMAPAAVFAGFEFSAEHAALVRLGAAPPAKAAYAFADAIQEAQRDAAVATLYRDILGRQPDAPGFAFWSAALAQGRSILAVAPAFADSPEAFSLALAGRSTGIGARNAAVDAAINAWAVTGSFPFP